MNNADLFSRIKVLPPQVANQIAAGEVVERPASAVKELLENSLDSGARSIEVEIEKGGIHTIRILDDGHGIHRDDLVLALSPHATSKISTADELNGVTSLGFRGEALASIASISRLSLTSRCASEESAWRISGDEMQVTPASLQLGTEVMVHDLFYNTPARRKFLRSERTEYSHVEEVVRRIALSRFDVAIRFSHNGKQILRLKALSREYGKRRLLEVLGAAFVENSIELDAAVPGLRLWGWIGRSGYSRSQADLHYFYLNGRMIRDRLAGHAVRLAFGDFIPDGRFPAYLLYLELDPQRVDVNVHPTKHEVRFREARQIHDFIYWAVKGALEKRMPSAGPCSDATSSYAITPTQGMYVRPSQEGGVRDRATHYAVNIQEPSAVVSNNPFYLGRAACLLRSGYLLAERDQTTIVVDMRHMLNELYYRRLVAPGGKVLLAAQPLLIPESVMLASDAASLWRERGAKIEPFGFEFGWLGEDLLVLRKVPAMVRSALIPSLLKSLETWLSHPDDGSEQSSDNLLRLLSSHAVPAQLPAYSIADLNALLREYEMTVPEAEERLWRELDTNGWQQLFNIIS